MAHDNRQPSRRRGRTGGGRGGHRRIRNGVFVVRSTLRSDVNHALSALGFFYVFHAQFGHGPASNPVPTSASRRARLAHRSPIEAQAEQRRAPLRQKPPALLTRAIPDRLVDELIGAMRSHRDRALLALYLSSGARASELLGVRGEHVDWTAGRSGWSRKAPVRCSRCRHRRRRCYIWRGISTNMTHRPRTS
jgi:integrase